MVGYYLGPFMYVPRTLLVKTTEDWMEITKFIESLTWFFGGSLVLYILAITLGQYLMSKRKQAFRMKGALMAWNFFMFVFSFVGSIALLPAAVSKPFTLETICGTWCYNEGRSFGALLGIMFVISKVLEFQDTFFLVLRKRPVIFLHWYHHIITMSFCWYWVLVGHDYNCSGLYFASMNFMIHTVMYFYYFLRAAGVNPNIDWLITTAQIAQMIIGTGIQIGTGYCKNIHKIGFWLGLIMYFSFFYLFVQFFTMRYVFKPKEKKKKRS